MQAKKNKFDLLINSICSYQISKSFMLRIKTEKRNRSNFTFHQKFEVYTDKPEIVKMLYDLAQNGVFKIVFLYKNIKTNNW